MRQENYLIALFNKDILDLRVRIPLPHALDSVFPQRFLASDVKGRSNRQYLTFGANTLTKALEWNLRYCLLEFLFDRRGLVRKEFVRERKRKDLVERLQRRFVFIGIINAIFAPFIVLYLTMYSFFRYFEVNLIARRFVSTWLTSSHRNTTRIPRRSGPASTRRTDAGSSESSTSCPTCLSGDWTRAILLRNATSISSPRRSTP